jgi:hypothetical protein
MDHQTSVKFSESLKITTGTGVSQLVHHYRVVYAFKLVLKNDYF